jgi:hypothetical protein
VVKNIVLLLGVVALIFALVESALRMLDLYPPPDAPVPLSPKAYVPDERVGYTLRPSTSSCHHYPLRGLRVLELLSNSDGFRSARELDDSDDRPRVMIVGDSFIFGLGVEEEERVAETLERIEPRWRVDGLSMPGGGRTS